MKEISKWVDKDKGVIPWPNEKWTRGEERTSPLDQVSQTSLREGKREGENNRERERKEERVFRERGSTFSLRFPAIGPSDPDEARSKVALHGKDYAWVPVSGSFNKLRERVGVFLLLDLLFA